MSGRRRLRRHDGGNCTAITPPNSPVVLARGRAQPGACAPLKSAGATASRPLQFAPSGYSISRGSGRAASLARHVGRAQHTGKTLGRPRFLRRTATSRQCRHHVVVREGDIIPGRTRRSRPCMRPTTSTKRHALRVAAVMAASVVLGCTLTVAVSVWVGGVTSTAEELSRRFIRLRRRCGHSLPA